MRIKNTLASRARRVSDTPERGTVTAEFSMVLTAITLVVVLIFGAINLGMAQLRVSEAAASAARAYARGEDEGTVTASVQQLAGSSVSVVTSRNDEYTTVYLEGSPSNSLAQVFHIQLQARASARTEGVPEP